MLEEIEGFLSGVVSPELTEVYVDAARALVESGVTTHIVQLEVLIDEEENIGRDQVVNEFDAYLKNALESTLNQYGVFLGEEFKLKQATAIYRSLNLLDGYDDVETIEAICLSGESPEERLAALVELTSEYTVEDILLNLDRVNTSLFERLLALIERVDDGLSELPAERTNSILRIKSCTDQLDEPWLMEYVDAGGTINRPVKDMADAFRSIYEGRREKDVMLDRNIPLLSLQFMSFILASNTPDTDLLRVSEEAVEETFLKLPLIIRVMEQVREILSAVPHEKA